MQLRRLTVRNIRSHERTEVEFPPGTTLLVGDVGAGKTSLLYAMEMALFGFAEVDAAYLIRHSTSQAEVTLTLADGETTHELRRRFRRRTVKGRDIFQIESNSYARDGVERNYSATELRQRSIELLGFPDNPNPRAHSDLWRWAVYLPQERMREVLEQPPADRLSTIRKALGVERYRIAADNARVVARELDQLAQRRTAEAQGLAHFAEAIDRIATDQNRLDAEIAELHRTELAVAEEVRRLEGQVGELEAAQLRRSRSVAEIQDLTSRRENAQSSMSTLDARSRQVASDRDDLEKELASEPYLISEAAGLESRELELRRSRAQVETRLARLRETTAALEGCEATIRALRESIVVAEGEIVRETRDEQHARERLIEAERTEPVIEPAVGDPTPSEELDAAILEARQTADQLHGELAKSELVARDIDELLHDGRCPRCHQPVQAKEFEPHRAEAQERVGEVRAALEAAAERLQNLEKRRTAQRAVERSRVEWLHIEERRHSIRTTVAEAAARRDTARERRDADALRVGVQETERARLTGLREADSAADDEGRRLDRELEKIRTERFDAAQRLTRIRARRPESSRLAEELRRIDHEREERLREVAEIDSRVASTRSELDRLPHIEEELPETQSQRDAARRRLDELHRRQGNAMGRREQTDVELRQARDGAERRSQLNAAARRDSQLGRWLSREFREAMMALEQRLLRRAQAEFQAAFGRYFHSLVDDSSLVARLDSAFAPAVEIEGEWTPAEALSGGERTALALAYRLALGHVVRSFGELRLETLILDEPTDGFSPEQVLRMGELLSELHLPQVVIVSHEAALGAVADRVLRIRKESGSSFVSGGGLAETPPVRPPVEPGSAAAARPPGSRGSRRRRKTLEEAVPSPPAT